MKILNGKNLYTSRESNSIFLAYQSQDRPVTTRITLQLQASGNWDLLPGRSRIQDAFRVQILSSGNWETFPGIKRPTGEAYVSSPSGAKFKNAGNLISILPYVLLMWTGTLRVLRYLLTNMQIQIKTQNLSVQPITFPSFHPDNPACWVKLIPNNL